MVTLPSVPLKVQVAPPGQLIRETLRGLSVRSNVRIRCVGAAKDAKNTDCLYGAVGYEKLGERRSGAKECAFSSGFTSFDRSWGGVGDGGEEGNYCRKGEDLHVWS